MKISEHWLREWVDPPISSAELVARLTMAGLEVDSVEPVAPAFNAVVVGRVVDLTAHPNAEHLRVAQVDVGGGAPLRIVCGAPNVKVDMRAPVALAGATLPGGVVIQPSELRGVPSQGMLCSAAELGVSDQADGLMELPADSAPGADLRALLDLDDPLIEIDLTPNRGDCLSIAGIAREVGVLNRQAVNAVATTAVSPTLDATFPVVVTAPADCPRYVGRVLRDLDPTAPTPAWMRERLRRAGLRSLGPLVDVTNYVMLELGQPLHAFDLERLRGRIEVRRARDGETLTLLTGESTPLHADTLLITDERGPIALAGVMGGTDTAVTPGATRHVFLESAFFSPTSIAGRARRYGLSTDASHRFERGVDPQLQGPALERATCLLLDIAGGEAGPVIEAVAVDHLPAQPAIRLRWTRLRALLGLDLDPDSITEILTRLGMAAAREGDHWLVVPPSFRFDVTIEADLIEEIGRIHGYDRLPSQRPLARLELKARPEGQIDVEQARAVLVQRGFQEAITYSFVDPVFEQALHPDQPVMTLANPISADLAVMRGSLWPGLLKALLHNQKRQQGRVRLFESGLVFIGQGADLVQEPRVAGVVCGKAQPEQWGESKRAADFFDVKADVEALLDLTGAPETFSFRASTHPALHPAQTARIERADAAVGWLGALHPAVAQRLGLEGGILLFELRLDAIRQGRVPSFAELSKFPHSRRDIAVVVLDTVSARELETCIRERGGELLREVLLFDVYQGPGIVEGHKSMAFGLILQDFSRNLTDLAVDEIVSGIIAGLEQRFGATLRN